MTTSEELDKIRQFAEELKNDPEIQEVEDDIS